MKNFNYQIMTNKNEDGKYVPNYEMLIANSSCEEEADAWRKAESFHTEFTWNMVVAMKMACGHWEVFQSSVNEYNPLDETLELLYEHSLHSECTKCICGWNK